LVSGWKRKRVAAWLGVPLEQSCETWSAWDEETCSGIAKGFKTWARCIMAATVTLSIQPERTDAHVGLIAEWRVFRLGR
jgi:hypothetical protein